MADQFQKHSPDLDSPAGSAAAVTPNDSTDLATSSRALYVGGAGDVKVDMAHDGTVTFSDVPAGTILPIRAERVYAAGTSATNIVAIW